MPSGPIAGWWFKFPSEDLNDDLLANYIFNKRAVYLSDDIKRTVFTEKFYERTKSVPYENLRKTIKDINCEKSHQKLECYLQENYERRTAVNGPILTRSMIETRFPFIDNDVLDYVYKIPIELRTERKLLLSTT